MLKAIQQRAAPGRSVTSEITQSSTTSAKVKVKFSLTRCRALGTELIPVYRQSSGRRREVNHAIDRAVGCRYFLPGLRLPRSYHQMALPVNGSIHLIPALLLIYRPRKDERLSWPSWLTCSGWFTHISGHPLAAGRALDRESSPVRDRRSITVPRHCEKQVTKLQDEFILRYISSVNVFLPIS